MTATEALSEPWLKTEQETPQAYQAFVDYKDMGERRSLHNLLEAYRNGSLYKSCPENVPTDSLRTLKNWSTVHGWQVRVQAWDSAQSRIAAERSMLAVAQEHDRRLERFRQLNQDNGDAMLRLSKDLMAVGSAMLGVMATELKKVQTDQANGDRIALDKFTNATARLLSVASQLAQAGADISAVCLGMEPPGGSKQ